MAIPVGGSIICKCCFKGFYSFPEIDSSVREAVNATVCETVITRERRFNDGRSTRTISSVLNAAKLYRELFILID
jgi:hypothetical protein